MASDNLSSDSKKTVIKAVQTWIELQTSAEGKDFLWENVSYNPRGGSENVRELTTRTVDRAINALSYGHAYMLSSSNALDRRACPSVWAGEEALLTSGHITMIIEEHQAVMFHKGKKVSVCESEACKADGGAKMNFDERFGEPNMILPLHESMKKKEKKKKGDKEAESQATADNLSDEEKKALEIIDKTADCASKLWAEVVLSAKKSGQKLNKESYNGLSKKPKEKEVLALKKQIEKILTDGSSVIYSTDSDINYRDVDDYLEDARLAMKNGVCSMAVKTGEVSLLAGKEKVVYSADESESEGEGEAEA